MTIEARKELDPGLDLYYWPTPNGWKITILLEELQQTYNLIPIDIRKGEQFNPDFLSISPNNKIPALVDRNPENAKSKILLFESAAIMMYLAEKYGRFWPSDLSLRYEVVQWLVWQTSALGPIAGQVHHFREYATTQIPYAIERFTNEINRLYGVINARLADREFLAGEYSIADMACWAWLRLWRHHGQNIDEFQHLKRWLQEVGTRPAVDAGFRVGSELRQGESPMPDEARKFLLNQTARVQLPLTGSITSESGR